jgi:polar amino acid transport system substrate-binding protein
MVFIRNTKRLYVLLFVLFIHVSVPFQASSAEPKSIKFAIGEWPPYTSEALDEFGFSARIVTAVIKEMGYQAEYEFMPWKRSYMAVESGSVWATFPIKYTQKRSEMFNFSDAIADSLYRFFYFGDKMKNTTWETYEDLQNASICASLGFWYIKPLEDAGLKLDIARMEKNSIDKLVLGRCDLLPINELVGWQIIKTKYADRIAEFGILEKPVTQSYDVHLLVSKKYQNTDVLLEQFNAALKRIKEKGVYNKILKTYEGSK